MLALMSRRAGRPDRFDAEAALACADSLYNLARHLTGSGTAAEDLVQETYARGFSAAASFTPGTNVRAWLFRILRNAFIDDRRRAKSAPATSPLDDEPAPADGPALDPASFTARDVASALASLSDDARTIVLLDLEGLTETECADVLECALGTVKSRLARARAQLRAKLKDYAR
jgi:RNA polymerase sigma-70 factor (ECF subfamily)